MADLLGAIANPQMADIAGALDYRQKKIQEDENRRRDLQFNEIASKALSTGLKEGSTLQQLAANNPAKYIMFSKSLGIDPANGAEGVAMSDDIGAIYNHSVMSPQDGVAFVDSLVNSRNQLGLDTSRLQSLSQMGKDNPQQFVNVVTSLHNTLNVGKGNSYQNDKQMAAKDTKGNKYFVSQVFNSHSGQTQSKITPINGAPDTPVGQLEFISGATGQAASERPAQLHAEAQASEQGKLESELNLQPKIDAAKKRAENAEKAREESFSNGSKQDQMFSNIKIAREYLPLATGSFLGKARDFALGSAGYSTDAANYASKLNVIAGAMVANVPRFEGPQSDADVKSYKAMVGDVGNDSIPSERRLAALDAIEQLMHNYKQIGDKWVDNRDKSQKQQSAPKDQGNTPAQVKTVTWGAPR